MSESKVITGHIPFIREPKYYGLSLLRTQEQRVRSFRDASAFYSKDGRLIFPSRNLYEIRFPLGATIVFMSLRQEEMSFLGRSFDSIFYDDTPISFQSISEAMDFSAKMLAILSRVRDK